MRCAIPNGAGVVGMRRGPVPSAQARELARTDESTIRECAAGGSLAASEVRHSRLGFIVEVMAGGQSDSSDMSSLIERVRQLAGEVGCGRVDGLRSVPLDLSGVELECSWSAPVAVATRGGETRSVEVPRGGFARREVAVDVLSEARPLALVAETALRARVLCEISSCTRAKAGPSCCELGPGGSQLCPDRGVSVSCELLGAGVVGVTPLVGVMRPAKQCVPAISGVVEHPRVVSSVGSDLRRMFEGQLADFDSGQSLLSLPTTLSQAPFASSTTAPSLLSRPSSTSQSRSTVTLPLLPDTPWWTDLSLQSVAVPAAPSREQVWHLMLDAKAPSTVSRYNALTRQFEEFALQLGHQPWPSASTTVAMWFTSLALKGSSPSTVGLAGAALSWAHHMRGFPSPMSDPTLRLVAQGAQRRGAKPITHKSVFTPLQIKQLIDSILKSDSLKNLRLATMISVSFGALLRLDEVHRIQLSDVVIKQDCVVINIPHSKTDQLRLGNTRRAAAMPDLSVCPVRLLRLYLARLGVERLADSPDNRPLFPALSGASSPLWGKGPVTKDAVRRQLKWELSACGALFRSMTWHSLRASAASAVAHAGAPAHIIQQLGAWHSEAWRTYVAWSDAPLVAAARGVWSGAADNAASPLVSPSSHLHRSRAELSLHRSPPGGGQPTTPAALPLPTSSTTSPRTTTAAADPSSESSGSSPGTVVVDSLSDRVDSSPLRLCVSRGSANVECSAVASAASPPSQGEAGGAGRGRGTRAGMTRCAVSPRCCVSKRREEVVARSSPHAGSPLPASSSPRSKRHCRRPGRCVGSGGGLMVEE